MRAGIEFWPLLAYVVGMQHQFAISPSATARIAHLLKSEPEGSRLRVAVEGGGCSGFQYRYDFEQAAPTGDDLVFGTDSAPVVVDTTSLQFLEHATLDYVESLDGSMFEIKNPNAKGGCGCGNSFSVAL